MKMQDASEKRKTCKSKSKSYKESITGFMKSPNTADLALILAFEFDSEFTSDDNQFFYFDQSKHRWLHCSEPKAFIKEKVNSWIRPMIEARYDMTERYAAVSTFFERGDRIYSALIKECGDTFYNIDFILTLDKNPSIFCCQDGVVELDTGVFRDATPHDYTSIGSSVSYRVEPSSAIQAEIMDFFDKLFPQSETVEYVLCHLASCLWLNLLQVAHFYLGDRPKVQLMVKLLRKIMGEYAFTCPQGILTNENIVKRDEHLYKLVPSIKRVALVEDLTQNSHLIEGHYRRLVATEESNSFHMICACEQLPIIKERTEGFWRRVQVLPLDGSVDLSVEERFDAWAPHLLHMLVERAHRSELPTCDVVKEAKGSYRQRMAETVFSPPEEKLLKRVPKVNYDSELNDWFEFELEIDPIGETPATVLNHFFSKFMKERGKAVSIKLAGRYITTFLENKNFSKKHSHWFTENQRRDIAMVDSTSYCADKSDAVGALWKGVRVKATKPEDSSTLENWFTIQAKLDSEESTPCSLLVHSYCSFLRENHEILITTKKASREIMGFLADKGITKKSCRFSPSQREAIQKLDPSVNAVVGILCQGVCLK